MMKIASKVQKYEKVDSIYETFVTACEKTCDTNHKQKMQIKVISKC
jgi:hypothetical protein